MSGSSFLRGDRWHREADLALKELLQAGSELVTTEDVFSEVVTGLLGRAGHRVAARAGRGILASPSLVLVMTGRDVFDEGWEMFQRYDRMGWSLTDCTSMVVMKRRSIRRAFAFDSDFKKMGFDLIPRI